MKLFVHHTVRENSGVVDVQPDQSVGSALGVHPNDEIWSEGGDEPLDREQSVEAAGLRHGGHVFCGPVRCRRVIVAVRYNGATISSEFAPGTRIATILTWAIADEELALSNPAPGDFTFKMSSEEVFPDLDDLIGRFVRDDCEVMFDLCPADKFQG